MTRLERAIQFIDEMGGTLIGETFMRGTEGKKKYRYANVRCKNGHEWCTQVDSLDRKGTWCSICKAENKKAKHMESLTTIISQKGGTLLSDIYCNDNSHHPMVKIRCSEGHEWETAVYNVISSGQWCRKCYGTDRTTVEEVRVVVEERGGKLLTEQIENNRSIVLVQCAFEEHPPFEMSVCSIMTQGSWCTKCRRSNVREELVRSIFVEAFGGKPFNCTRKEDCMNGLELDGYNSELKLAWEHNGRQHYEYIHHFHRKMSVFEAQLERDQRKKVLCENAGITLIIIKYDVPIRQLREHVRAKITDAGFTDLSPPVGTVLSLYNKIRVAGPNANSAYDEIRKIVEGGDIPKGKIVSKSYIGSTVPMMFKCNNPEHPEFSMMCQLIKKGKFCLKCENEAKSKAYRTEIISKYGWIEDHIETYETNGRIYKDLFYRKCNVATHPIYQINTSSLSKLKNGSEYGLHTTHPCELCTGIIVPRKPAKKPGRKPKNSS